jgi:hypothetical protein
VIIKELLGKIRCNYFLPCRRICVGVAREAGRGPAIETFRRADATGPGTPARVQARLDQWFAGTETVVLEVATAAAAAAPAAMMDTMVDVMPPDDAAGTAPCDAPPAA